MSPVNRIKNDFLYGVQQVILWYHRQLRRLSQWLYKYARYQDLAVKIMNHTLPPHRLIMFYRRLTEIRQELWD